MTIVAAVVLAAAGVFSSQSYDKPMEIGNYDVTIDLPAGKAASVNYVKFMGRRLAIDRTELKAGEKKSVSFTARVPGPYTTRPGDAIASVNVDV